jgi:hypothetical protein
MKPAAKSKKWFECEPGQARTVDLFHAIEAY